MPTIDKLFFTDFVIALSIHLVARMMRGANPPFWLIAPLAIIGVTSLAALPILLVVKIWN